VTKEQTERMRTLAKAFLDGSARYEDARELATLAHAAALQAAAARELVFAVFDAIGVDGSQDANVAFERLKKLQEINAGMGAA
jgi:hypothetical protein